MTSEASQAGDREQRLNLVIAAFLQAVDAGQPSNQQALLERHPDLAEGLRSFFADRDRFRALAGTPAAERAESKAGSEAATLAPGQTPAGPLPGTSVRYFGDYELLEEIARGGMGVIYKARQVSLNRLVALKMILAGQLASEADVQRFRREAETAAQLDHPNVVPIYEVGEHQGQHYFSMKLIEGGSLTQWLHSEPRPSGSAEQLRFLTVVARILAAVARAVHHAHQRGLLHRDLKPANVLLEADGTPLVTDFGLARPVEGGAGLTRTGAVVGTPGYLAPEQAAGKKALTTAADVYGLGAILYELLTNRPPFRGETPLEIVLQTLEREPPRPRTLNPRLDRDLETVCLKCLEKDPQARYGSAQALAEDLERWPKGEPIQARPVGTAGRLWRWCRRKPAVAALIAAVVLALVTGTAISTAFAVSAYAWAQTAEAQAELAGNTERRAVMEKDRADKQRERARRSEHDALQNLYASRMGQASYAWQVGQVDRVVELLRATRPTGADMPDFRGFEWYYLDRLCHAGLFTLKGHEGPVQSVAYSPDGRLVALAGGSFTSRTPAAILVYDAATGQQVSHLRGHRWPVAWLVFSPDGKYLASARKVEGALFGREVVTIWEVASGNEVASLAGHSCAAFSPDGKHLATAGPREDKNAFHPVIVWDWRTGKQAKVFPGHDALISSLDFSKDGRHLAVAGYLRGERESLLGPGSGGVPSVRVWDLSVPKEVLTLKHSGGVTRVSFSPAGTHLASGGGDMRVRVWDAATGRELFSLPGHIGPITGVAYSKDGKQLASAAANDQSIRLWDAGSGRELRTFRGHTAGVNAVSFSPDGRWLATGSADGTAKVWEVSRDQEALTFPIPGPPLVHGLAFHPDGKQLACCSNGVTLWDVTTGKQVGSFSPFNDPEGTVAFSPNGKLLAAAETDGRGRIWDTITGKQIASFSRREVDLDFASQLAFSSDGKRLLVAGAKGIQVLGVPTCRDEGRLDLCGGYVSSLALHPDGQVIATTGGYPKGNALQNEVALWNLAEAKKILSLESLRGKFVAVAFRRDGRLLVAAGIEGVTTWETATGKELSTFRLPASAMVVATFNADGTRLATMGPTGASIWDVTTGQQLLSLPAITTGLHNTLAFNPGGTRLVEAGRRWVTTDKANGPAPRDAQGQLIAVPVTTSALRVWDATPRQGTK
jgi:WD40 repeat protein/tRNA A-37 threonylcarbamoyl transferase component Bud32